MGLSHLQADDRAAGKPAWQGAHPPDGGCVALDELRGGGAVEDTATDG